MLKSIRKNTAPVRKVERAQRGTVIKPYSSVKSEVKAGTNTRAKQDTSGLFTITKGRTTYAKKAGGSLKEEEKKKKRNKILNKVRMIQGKAPVVSLTDGERMVMAPRAKKVSSCGCGGKKKFQQGGVMGGEEKNASGTDVDLESFNLVENGLFPGGQDAAKLSGGLEAGSDKKPTIPANNSVDADNAFKYDFIKKLKLRRKKLGLNTESPTSEISNDGMFNSGYGKSGGNTNKIDSTGAPMMQDGGPMNLDMDYFDMAEYLMDGGTQKKKKEKEKAVSETEEAVTPVGTGTVLREDSDTETLKHMIDNPKTSDLERAFNIVDGGRGRSFGRLMHFIGDAASAESFMGEKLTNDESSAAGVFHFLTKNGGGYDKNGKKVATGNYTKDGKIKKNSFSTAKQRMSNMLNLKGFDEKFKKDPKLRESMVKIVEAKSPFDLSNQEQALLLYADLRMRGGQGYSDFIDNNSGDEGLALYRDEWVTLGDKKNQSADVIRHNWINARVRNAQDSNAKWDFFGINNPGKERVRAAYPDWYNDVILGGPAAVVKSTKQFKKGGVVLQDGTQINKALDVIKYRHRVM